MNNNKIRILYFITEDWYFWSHRLAIARAALREGMDVYIVCQVNDYGKKILNEGFNLIPIKINRSGKSIFTELSLFYTLLKIYRKIRPDIVHHVAIKPTLYGSLVARLTGVPHIVNALAGLGHLFVSHSRKDSIVRYLVKKGMGLALNASNVKIILQNKDDLSILLNSSLIADEQACIIKGSGVDIDTFKPLKIDSQEVPTVVLLSRMLWTKGVGEFVEAARLLREKQINVRMILVGEPDPVNPASIKESELIGWDREGVVEYWGRRDNVHSILQRCAVSVLPSYREGLPKSLIESAAVSLPLVAFDVPGCREIVRHDVNGLLVPFKDVQALVAAIERLVLEPSLRKVMGEMSRQIAVDEFSLDIVVKQTLALYEQLLDDTKLAKIDCS